MAMDETPGSITPPQFKFICDLVSQKDLTQLTEAESAFLTSGETNLLRMSKKQADTAIKKLLDLPKKEQAEPVTTVPAAKTEIEATQLKDSDSAANMPVPDPGYYFIVDPTSEPAGKESFFRVSKPDENSRWHGYTFLAIQASDDFYSIKDKTRRDIIYAEILKDPINAMNEYGIRLGRCGVCNRTLTDRDSRLRGIGPICAARLDSTPSQEDIDLLTALGMINPDGDEG